MTSSIKTCYFYVDGPLCQNSPSAGPWRRSVHTLVDSPKFILQQCPNDIVEMPRIRFQAQMTFVQVHDKRILLNDRFGRQWSVYASDIDALIPVMVKGVVEAWWTIVKRGNMYGLNVDLATPLGSVHPDQDVPLMLEKVSDIRLLEAHFQAMAA